MERSARSHSVATGIRVRVRERSSSWGARLIPEVMRLAHL
jgi:hypothetical protein